jgi:hypothetical protein
MAKFKCGECIYANEHPKKKDKKICKAKAPIPKNSNYADNRACHPIWPEVDPEQNSCGDAIKE